ncbi:hypothetical protein X801_09045 [Opisthorchis viverrini]|uniref:Uncharacterized protein n=1 Tax=Opisthorchis viverrini TaxID=6198 RepID=A0A1S8WL43_OPIVI|nr:hypothetical protein X801_09045 [Opisthorchis viverrini]
MVLGERAFPMEQLEQLNVHVMVMKVSANNDTKNLLSVEKVVYRWSVPATSFTASQNMKFTDHTINVSYSNSGEAKTASKSVRLFQVWLLSILGDKVYLIRYIPFGDSESDLLEAHPEALESNLNRRNDGVLDRSAVVELSFAVPDQNSHGKSISAENETLSKQNYPEILRRGENDFDESEDDLLIPHKPPLGKNKDATGRGEPPQ